MRRAAVLVPGTLCDARLFAPMLESLPLAGTVANLCGNARVETAAAAILSTVPGRFAGIGFSLGGFVLLEMMRQAPERLSAIILLSGNAHPDAPANAAIRRAEVDWARANGMAAFVDAHLPRYVGRASLTDRALRTVLADMAGAAGHEVHREQAEMNIHRPDFRSTVASPPAPLLVVAGAEDALCPWDRYANAARGGELALIEHAGHFAPLEAPRRVAEVVVGWLERKGAA